MGDHSPWMVSSRRGGGSKRGLCRLIQEETMRPEELSRQLWQGSGEFLSRGRKTVGLALTAAGSMGLISLYQIGVIEHLPEAPRPRPTRSSRRPMRCSASGVTPLPWG